MDERFIGGLGRVGDMRNSWRVVLSAMCCNLTCALRGACQVLEHTKLETSRRLFIQVDPNAALVL